MSIPGGCWLEVKNPTTRSRSNIAAYIRYASCEWRSISSLKYLNSQLETYSSSITEKVQKKFSELSPLQPVAAIFLALNPDWLTR